MLLITGPSACGKTSFCLERIREHLRAGDRNWRLLVPTATLAEHLRNQLAREGFVFSPAAISTLAKFVDGLVEDVPEISPGALELITGDVLARACPTRYLPVREFAGFRRALASAIDEFTSAGATLPDLPQQAADFGAIVAPVLASIRARGLNLNAWRLQAAQSRLSGADTAHYLVGFYSFNNPEIEFIRALADRGPVTIAITEWDGSRTAIARLRKFARETRTLAPVAPSAQRTVVAAPTLDAELTDIARRLRSEYDAGRLWRDMGIVVRSEQPYVLALRSTLERFGIPARFYFAPPVAQNPVIRYLTSTLQAMLGGWDHGAALEALRLAGSPLEHDDRFEFDVRERLPGSGLAELTSAAGPSHAEYFAQLDRLTPWAGDREIPAVWSDRFLTLPALCQASPVEDGVSHEHALMLRSRASALAAWVEAVTNAAALLPASPIPCDNFFAAVRTMLESMSLRTPDHRRDVVHVIDAFEARQWRLPVLFVCGLIEKQFPKYHSENPVLDDGVRRHLQSRGIPVRTSSERQSDEQFLFECLLGRAVERVVLSYPVLNAKADSNLASFLLERAKPFGMEDPIDARPAPVRERAPSRHPGIFDERLRDEFARKHSIIAASAVESYLQCPYQFFAQRTLELEEPPADPWSRLDAMVQGEIAHAVLERFYRDRQPLVEAFDQLFAAACSKHRIPDGYRTEAIRLDLVHNLQLLAYDSRLKTGGKSLYEQKFELPLGDGTTVRGRIDRLEIDADGRAVVFDYKYSSRNSIMRTENGHDEKTRIQGGLYLLALPTVGPFTPAGMVYCGFKRELSFGGWIIRPHYTDIRKDCDPNRLQDVMRMAREAALETAQSIRSGLIRPAPADEGRCEFCACAKMCRVEMIPAVALAGGAR